MTYNLYIPTTVRGHQVFIFIFNRFLFIFKTDINHMYTFIYVVIERLKVFSFQTNKVCNFKMHRVFVYLNE